jgi:hypothetical protein
MSSLFWGPRAVPNPSGYGRVRQTVSGVDASLQTLGLLTTQMNGIQEQRIRIIAQIQEAGAVQGLTATQAGALESYLTAAELQPVQVATGIALPTALTPAVMPGVDEAAEAGTGTKQISMGIFVVGAAAVVFLLYKKQQRTRVLAEPEVIEYDIEEEEILPEVFTAPAESEVSEAAPIAPNVIPLGPYL